MHLCFLMFLGVVCSQVRQLGMTYLHHIYKYATDSFHCPKIGLFFTDRLTMAQIEKRGGLLRKSSASKKPLKEKVVLMYDEIFMVRPGTGSYFMVA